MLYIRQLIDNELFEKAEELVKVAIELFPKEGAFLKYYGDLLYRIDKKQAYIIYGKAMRTTSNGCTHLEIKERTISDKALLISEAKADHDLHEAELLIQLVDDDVDFYILKHQIILGLSQPSTKLIILIEEIQMKLAQFDYAPKLLKLLQEYFIFMGESSGMSDIRIKCLLAKNADDYHRLASELQLVPDDIKDGNYFKVLGDVCANLGLFEDANDDWRLAKTLSCSQITTYELDRFFLKEISQ